MTRSGMAGASALNTVSTMVIGKRHPQAHRRRPHRADDAARRHDRLEAAERAVIDRIVGRRGQALVGDLRAGMAGGDAGIEEAADLARDVGEIDRHLLALDGRRAPGSGSCLPTSIAVVVHVGFGLVDAVGDRARARPRRRLRVIHDGAMAPQDLVAAVALDQFEETPLAGLDRGDLGAQIAHRAARQPHVHADDIDEVLVRPGRDRAISGSGFAGLRNRCRWSCRRACRRCRSNAPCSRRSRPARRRGRSAASRSRD